MPDRRNQQTELEQLNQFMNSDGSLIDIVRMFSESGTSFPVSPAPVERQMFYRSDLTTFYMYLGGIWVPFGSGGGMAPMIPLTITGQTFSGNKYVLTGSSVLTADQSFTPTVNQFSIVKSGIRNAVVGSGGGGGFIFEFTSSASKVYRIGIDTLSTSHQLFAVLDALGSPTFVAGPNLGFRPAVEQLWFGLFWEDAAGGNNALPLVYCRVADLGGGNYKDMTWSPGNIAGTWPGASVAIKFYIDDNATSTISYMGPAYALRSDMGWF